jgi:hypothetical protein
VQNDRFFDEGDVQLLAECLSLVPDFEFAVFLTKLAGKKLKFPIAAHKELSQLFPKNKGISFKTRTVTFANSVKFLRKELFPITDQKDFFRKALIGIGAAAFHHASASRVLRERASRRSGKLITTLIPPGLSEFRHVLQSF